MFKTEPGMNPIIGAQYIPCALRVSSLPATHYNQLGLALLVRTIASFSFSLSFYPIMGLFFVSVELLIMVVLRTLTIDVVPRVCTLYFVYNVNDLSYRL